MFIATTGVTRHMEFPIQYQELRDIHPLLDPVLNFRDFSYFR